MPPKEKRTERIGVRLTPEELETLRQATEIMQHGDMSDLVRRASLAAASGIVQTANGEIPPFIAGSALSGLLFEFLGWAKMIELSKNEVPGKGVNIKTIIEDLEGNVYHFDDSGKLVVQKA